MEIITSIQEMKDYVKYLNENEQNISFIPTMGNLHKGHISLIDESKKILSKKIASIFVNPLQFNDKKDLDTYPSNTEEDIQILKENNIDCLFMPNEDILSDLDYKIYLPDGFGTYLCGRYREGHFEGVYKIVNKLLDLVRPNFTYFGKKDYQQILLVKYILQKNPEKFKKINLVECKTIRETNGLALSSRNSLLTEGQKNIASEIFQCLIDYKNIDENIALKKEFKDKIDGRLQEKGIEMEYFEVFNVTELHTLHNISFSSSDHKIVFIAARIFGIRLIDNIEIE